MGIIYDLWETQKPPQKKILGVGYSSTYLTNEDKKHNINFDEIVENVLKNVPKQNKKYVLHILFKILCDIVGALVLSNTLSNNGVDIFLGLGCAIPNGSAQRPTSIIHLSSEYEFNHFAGNF